MTASCQATPGRRHVPPLAGFTVGVTAARRADELGTMLERRGAPCSTGRRCGSSRWSTTPSCGRHPQALIEQPPDITVATTGIGFRGWVQAATNGGSGENCSRRSGAGQLIARGPKARGAIRASGLTDAWSPPSESSTEVLEYLLDRGCDGLRIAVQQHGEPLPDVVEALDRRRRGGDRGAGVPLGAARRPRARSTG